MSNAIPEGWNDEPLSHFCKGIRGVSYKPDDLSIMVSENTVTLLRSNNIQESGLVLADVQHVNKAKVRPVQLAKSKDIAVCMSNGSKRLVGKSSSFQEIPNTGKYTVGAFCSIFRPTKYTHPDFVRQLFNSNQYIQQVGLSLAGSAINNLKNSDVEEYRFLSPPLPEQKKIASILTSVDEVIEKTESQIAKLQDLKTGMMQELLTKGIGHTGFKDFQVVRIPTGWEILTLKDIVQSIKSGLSRRIVSQDIGIPVLISGNIQKNLLDTKELKFWYLEDPQGAKTENYMLEDGDILLCFINSVSQIGKSCIYRDIGRPAIYTTNMFRIVAKSDYASEYIHLLLTTPYFREQIQLITKPAVNQASFTKADLELIPIAVPPKIEREKITKAILSVDCKLKKSNRILKQYVNLKQALMQDLLTGKVRVKPD